MTTLSVMQKGFNSDITVKGKVYHVQTEDWGQDNPFIVSRIFANGAVLKTIKVSYQEALKEGASAQPSNRVEAIKLALKKQHHRILDQLVTGQV